VVVVAAGLPARAWAQQPDSTPQLGLGASSAISIHAGAGRFKHAALGSEIGGALDLGWIGSRRVRLSVGLDYLSTTISRSDSLGVRQRGPAYVFTAFADVTALMPLVRRATPYGGVGFGIDAVGTSISNEQVGFLYNTNVFDLHAQAGSLFYMTPRTRVQVEARVTGARVVRRFGVRVGYVWLFNGLP
jgi:hypothetical protein